MADDFKKRLIDANPALAEALEANAAKRQMALTLRKMRKRAGLTQEELAERSGLSQPQISRMERATGPMPDQESQRRFADGCAADMTVVFRSRDDERAEELRVAM